MAGPLDNYFSVQADVARFPAPPAGPGLSYHIGVNDPICIGDDTEQYLVYKIGNNSDIELGKVSTQTTTVYTNTDFQNFLSSLFTPLPVSGPITPIWVIPIPGTHWIFLIGVDRIGTSVPTNQQVVILRLRIDNTGTLVLD